MTCKDCKKAWRCIMACEEINEKLCRLDEEIERLDYLPPKKATSSMLRFVD